MFQLKSVDIQPNAEIPKFKYIYMFQLNKYYRQDKEE